MATPFPLVWTYTCYFFWWYRGIKGCLAVSRTKGTANSFKESGISNSVIIISVIMSLPFLSSSPHPSCSSSHSHWQSVIIWVINHHPRPKAQNCNTCNDGNDSYPLLAHYINTDALHWLKHLSSHSKLGFWFSTVFQLFFLQYQSQSL